MKEIVKLYLEVTQSLPDNARRFLNYYSVALGALAIFDAIALGLLALVIAPISSGSEVSLPFIGVLSPTQIIWVIVSICILIISKSVFSVLLLWWATRRFAKYELSIGNMLFTSYMNAPWEYRLAKNSSDLIRLTDGSVTVIVSAFLLPGATLFGEAMSLIAIITVLAIASPLVALITLFYLGLLGAILYFWIARHSRIAGRVNLDYSLKTARLITEMIGAMKEIVLRSKSSEAINVVSKSRQHATKARANIQFLGQVPRFVLDAGIIGGFLLVGTSGYLIQGISGALTSVALFGLAGFRMAPSVIRFQSIVSQMTSTSPHARMVLDEMNNTQTRNTLSTGTKKTQILKEIKEVSFDCVSYSYPGSLIPAIDNISLTIPIGKTVAFVGPSGSGKTTMIDLLLGLLEPTFGKIKLDNSNMNDSLVSWRSKVGYVPQEVSLFDASVAQNIALTWTDDFNKTKVIESLQEARLYNLIKNRDKDIDSLVGERGLSLSGGQKQRLGIARALYSNPEILVMDEGTSALDPETESEITTTIKNLKNTHTVILVAHRLSTIMHADIIFFLKDGKLVANGTFNELVKAVPDFEKQAKLSGLV